MNPNHIQVPILLPSVPGRSALWPYLGRIEENRHYTNFGPLNQELESRLAKKFSARACAPLFARTVSSATAGLELALASLGLPAGSKVLVPALTFVATLTAVSNAGLCPVVTDIDPLNWFLTPAIAAQAISLTGARAVLAVSTFGYAQDTNAWSALQAETGVRVVIDAAGAFGTQWLEVADVPVVFSMHATKSLTAGEGGFVVTGDQVFADQITELSNFGINLDLQAALPVGYLSSCGTNAKLSEFHAAVALASLDVWDQHAIVRNRLFQDYRCRLDQASDHSLTWQRGDAPAAPTLFCVRLGSPERRDLLEASCLANGIATRRWYQPLLHRHAPGIGNCMALPVAVSETIAGDLIGLPFFFDMTESQMALVVETVRHCFGRIKALSKGTPALKPA